MPTKEADAPVDKPFEVPSGEPLAASVDVAAELGLSEEKEEEPAEDVSDEQKKSNEEGQKVVDNYSAKIQEHSEQLYAISVQRVKTEPSHIETLIEGDKDDRKMAVKVLKNNPDIFGAGTIEDYQVVQARKQAGNSEAAQELAEIKQRQKNLEDRQSESNWLAWKGQNSVLGEAAELADTIRNDNPNMPWGLIMDAVKGRMGNKEGIMSKPSASTAVGSAAPPEGEEVDLQSPLARSLLRNVNRKETAKFAKSYSS